MPFRTAAVYPRPDMGGPPRGPAPRRDSGVTGMYQDAGASPAGSWNDLLPRAAEQAGRACARLRGRRPAPQSSAADPDRGRAPGATFGLLATVSAAGVAITLLVGVLPSIHFAYRSPAAHVFIDTAATVIALLVAILLAQRYRRSALARDLLIAAALGVLATANLLLSVVAALVATEPRALSSWALLGARLFGAALLAAAWVVPRARVRAPARTAALALGGCVAAIALLAICAVLFADQLPPAVDSPLPAAVHPRIVGHPLVLAAQLIGMVLLAAAGVGSARAARAEDDEFLAWLAAGAVLGAFARLNYFLFPSLFTDVVYTGDFFTLAFYLVLLTAALREIGAYHRRLAEVAVFQERRRVARDLHDGLAQDLAFIASRMRVLERDPHAAVRFDHLSSAAERALDDSRAAIAALTRPLDEPLDAALARNATEVAERLGARADLDLQPGVAVPAATREALVRMVREAVTNAVRHGRAGRIAVSLSRHDALQLSIADDGCGFDPAARPSRPDAGFGLLGMGERAETLGGTLAVRSAPGSGTTIEVVLPCPAP
jgi:signal transduction histidine kinase